MENNKRKEIEQRRIRLATIRMERDYKYHDHPYGFVTKRENAQAKAKLQNRRYYNKWEFRALAKDPIDAMALKDTLEGRGFLIEIKEENEEGHIIIIIFMKVEITEFTRELYYQTCGELWSVCGYHLCELCSFGISFGGEIDNSSSPS